MAVLFKYANENLDAIINGLGIVNGDTALSVCGPGDYAFAMACKGASVIAVDIDSSQINYSILRQQRILAGGIAGFCDTKLKNKWKLLDGLFGEAAQEWDDREDARRRDLFFQENQAGLVEAADRVMFYKGDLFTQDMAGIDKVYLWNVQGTVAGWDNMIARADSGTRFYASEDRYFRMIGAGSLSMVKVDDRLTEIARHYSAGLKFLRPLVFEKI
jgi:hypothetical protein